MPQAESTIRFIVTQFFTHNIKLDTKEAVSIVKSL